MLLKKVTEQDIGLLFFWFCKEEVRVFFGDPKEWTNEIVENLKNGSNWVFYYLVFVENIPIGFVQYYETNKAPLGLWSKEPDGTVGIDYLIGEPDFLKKGYGSRIIKSLVSLIRKTNKYRFIIADPMVDNFASISVLTNNGFIKQGNGLYRLIIK